MHLHSRTEVQLTPIGMKQCVPTDILHNFSAFFVSQKVISFWNDVPERVVLEMEHFSTSNI